MDLKLMPLTLATTAEGKLEERVQELLAEAYEVIQEAKVGAYQESPAGTVSLTITAKITISHKLGQAGEPGLTTIAAGAELKKPARRLQTQSTYTRSGAFTVEERAQEQEALSFVESASIRRLARQEDRTL